MRDEQHLLIADGPDALARACARLLGDPALRASMVGRAHELYLARYQSARVEDDVASLARELARP